MKKTAKKKLIIAMKPRAKEYNDRRSLNDLHLESLERSWNLFDSLPLNDWFKFGSGVPYPASYKSEVYVSDLKKEAVQEEKESLLHAHDDNGTLLQETAGLLPYQIKRYRQLFKNGEGDEIKYYFNKDDFFNKDGSIKVQDYLVLHYCGFPDIKIWEYFGISKGAFQYFKSSLEKTIGKDKMDEYAKMAYDEWNLTHPKRIDAITTQS